MKKHQADFLDFVIKLEALCFGDFMLKSGRQSPYFFNSGLFNTGANLAVLGRFYAAAIMDAGLQFDMLFGPAYKGIPLVSAVAIALADQYDFDCPYAFNRKEVKDHGEGGVIVGAKLRDRVLIIDDVISAGTSVRESVVLITQAGASVGGVAIALDRKERGGGDVSAIREVEREFALTVTSIVSFDDVIEYIQQGNAPSFANYLSAIKTYRELYGVS